MATVLELERISKDFPGHRAVEELSLVLQEGEFFSLLGPSGCGKTTTLRMVAGFETPSAGDVRLRGRRINELRPYERNVSTVFQSYALFPHLTVRENLEFGLRYRKGLADLRGTLEMLELAGKEDRLPAQLSGGERQRVALARSLVLRPDVLLLDEPLSALDPLLRKQVRAELKAIQRQVGIAFLFITHDQEEALSLSDRLAVMNQGRLLQSGTPEQVYLHPATRFVAGFLGRVNWIRGAGVRPEATRLADPPPGDDVRSAAGIVEHSVFLGNCLHVEARLSEGERVVAEVSRFEGVPQPGQSVRLWWHASDELRFPEQ